MGIIHKYLVLFWKRKEDIKNNNNNKRVTLRYPPGNLRINNQFWFSLFIWKFTDMASPPQSRNSVSLHVSDEPPMPSQQTEYCLREYGQSLSDAVQAALGNIWRNGSQWCLVFYSRHSFFLFFQRVSFMHTIKLLGCSPEPV